MVKRISAVLLYMEASLLRMAGNAAQLSRSYFFLFEAE
jgi:hypothetical protein